MSKIVFVHGDDWDGLYIDGVCVWQNHELEPETVLDQLGIRYESKSVDYDWLVERQRLPELLKDVVFDKEN